MNFSTNNAICRHIREEIKDGVVLAIANGAIGNISRDPASVSRSSIVLLLVALLAVELIPNP